MRVFGLILAVLAVCVPAEAVLVGIDADGFADGADISAAFGSVRLCAIGGLSGLDGSIYAWGDGYASTGRSVFANSTAFQRNWYISESGGFALRADFADRADYVAIDIIGDDAADVGELWAYDGGGGVIGGVVTSQLAAGEVFTAQITSDCFDIAYIIAGGATSSADTVHLDNLRVNVVPEPTGLCLFALAGLMARKNRRKGAAERSAN